MGRPGPSYIELLKAEAAPSSYPGCPDLTCRGPAIPYVLRFYRYDTALLCTLIRRLHCKTYTTRLRAEYPATMPRCVSDGGPWAVRSHCPKRNEFSNSTTPSPTGGNPADRSRNPSIRSLQCSGSMRAHNFRTPLAMNHKIPRAPRDTHTDLHQLHHIRSITSSHPAARLARPHPMR